MQYVRNVKIPRSTRIERSTRVELHGFADASEKAYGACIYLRTRSMSGEWKARLLCAKSGVAPLRSVSLPRLELCGILLLAQLAEKVKTALNFSMAGERYYLDSTIVLAWIHAPPNRWKTFVTNRIAEIQRLTRAECWKHVASEDNPADLLSRGTSSAVLATTFLWWSGPEALKGELVEWASTKDFDGVLPEERQPIAAFPVAADGDLFNRFSTFTRLIRVVGYCLRFIHRSQKNRPVEHAQGTTALSADCAPRRNEYSAYSKRYTSRRR